MKNLLLLLLCLPLCACLGGGTSGGSGNSVPSIEHLSELTLHAKGDREFLTSDINFISSQNNGTIDTITLHDNWYHRDIIFSKNTNNKYYATPYSYYLTYLKNDSTLDTIIFNSDTPIKTTTDIKQGFLDVLDTDRYDYLSNADKQNAINSINSININNAHITSKTELGNLIMGPGSVPNKLYIIQTNMALNVNTYGQQLGLQYSDFGALTGEQWVDNYNDREKLGYVFAGGDIDKKIIPSNNTMNFSGKAVGQVMLHTEDDYGVATNDYMYMESDATLVFDNGTENLTMNFSENQDENKRWYDVNIVKNNDNITVNLTNGDKIAQSNEKYKFSNSPINKTTEYINHIDEGSYLPEDWILREKANVDIEYYGDNNQISESVGTVSFGEQQWHNGTSANNELYFSGSFGVKKDE